MDLRRISEGGGSDSSDYRKYQRVVFFFYMAICHKKPIRKQPCVDADKYCQNGIHLLNYRKNIGE